MVGLQSLLALNGLQPSMLEHPVPGKELSGRGEGPEAKEQVLRLASVQQPGPDALLRCSCIVHRSWNQFIPELHKGLGAAAQSTIAHGAVGRRHCAGGPLGLPFRVECLNPKHRMIAHMHCTGGPLGLHKGPSGAAGCNTAVEEYPFVAPALKDSLRSPDATLCYRLRAARHAGRPGQASKGVVEGSQPSAQHKQPQRWRWQLHYKRACTGPLVLGRERAVIANSGKPMKS